MASTPAFKAKTSVKARCLPLGLMHPRANEVRGNISRATAVTLAISVGCGGSMLAISVPGMGMKAMITKAEGLTDDTILKA